MDFRGNTALAPSHDRAVASASHIPCNRCAKTDTRLHSQLMCQPRKTCNTTGAH